VNKTYDLQYVVCVANAASQLVIFDVFDFTSASFSANNLHIYDQPVEVGRPQIKSSVIPKSRLLPKNKNNKTVSKMQ